jgi:mono/diheme cytochrome c family protein
MKKLLSALFLGSVAFAALADDTSGSDLIKRGEYLAKAGDCVACHTTEGGQPFAGGLKMVTPIGAIYSTNITPDKANGIGDYTLEDFENAVRKGVAKNGQTLYPAMPFPSYAVVSDEDMKALYAYFMHGVQPVAQPNRDSDIPWPLSMRWPLAIWRTAFAPKVQPFAGKMNEDPQLARGITMQEKAMNNDEGNAFLSGSAAPIDGWTASNLRGDDRDGLGRWSEDDLVQFLRTGRNDHTAVFGGMTDVVKHSLQYLTPEDATAIAKYLKSLDVKDSSQPAFKTDDSVAKALWKGDDSKPGAAVYVDSCAACHKTDGTGYKRFFPELKGNPVVLAKDPTSLIHIVLTGNTLPGVIGAPSNITMPAFGWRLNNQQVADVVNFIRTSWGNTAGDKVTADDVKKIREDKNVITDKKQLGNMNIEMLTPIQ